MDMSFETPNPYQCRVTLKNVFFALTLVTVSCFLALEKRPDCTKGLLGCGKGCLVALSPNPPSPRVPLKVLRRRERGEERLEEALSGGPKAQRFFGALWLFEGIEKAFYRLSGKGEGF